jgi:hypothetical protein
MSHCYSDSLVIWQIPNLIRIYTRRDPSTPLTSNSHGHQMDGQRVATWGVSFFLLSQVLDWLKEQSNFISRWNTVVCVWVCVCVCV